MPTGYPQGAPTVSGTLVTVDAFLKMPPMVTKVITDLTLNRFIADHIFAAGPQAVGGAVLYDKVLAGQWFTARDVQAIEPGAEFPILNTGETAPSVATVSKWGGAVSLTDEAIRRDRRDLLSRELTKLTNTIVKKVDTVAVASLQAAVDAGATPTGAASATWATSTTDIITDLEVARSAIDNADLGYVADTVIIGVTAALGLRKNAGIRAALPRESKADNLIGGDLNGLLRFPYWFVSNRVPLGEAWVLASKQVGSISDELPLYSRVVPQPERERQLIMAARPTTPYVTDPLAAYKITGTNG